MKEYKEWLAKMNDEELVQQYKKCYRDYLGWSRCMDGSGDMYWEYNVEPVIAEWINRGYAREDLVRRASL